MAVVPYSPRRAPDPLEGVSDSFKLMAMGQLYQEGGMVQQVSEKKVTPSLPEMTGAAGGSGGGSLRSVPDPKIILDFEKALGDVQSGSMTRMQFRDLVNKRGWSVEESGSYGMRGKRDELRIFDPDGREHYISY